MRSEKKRIVIINKSGSVIALVVLQLLTLLKRKRIIKRLKQEPSLKLLLLLLPLPLKLVIFMKIMLEALFRISFIS